MSYIHNNQLNMVSLFDDDEPLMGQDHSKVLPLSQYMTDYYGAVHYNPELDNHGSNAHRNDARPHDHTAGNGGRGDDYAQNGDGHADSLGGRAPTVKIEGSDDGSPNSVSYSHTFSSEDGESDYGARRSSRVHSRAPKINKDGAPRKPRQPRPKLLKWTDNDWKNVVLGIIWACGETGVTIPFDQAAQVVGENCTAGAMQQAILKLRQKQIDQGYDIPSLKMAWTRKNRNRNQDLSSRSSSTNAKTAKRSLVVKLKVRTSPKVKTPSPPPEADPVDDAFFSGGGMFDMAAEDYMEYYGDVFGSQGEEFTF
jgi:hypothetical protein